MSKTAKKKNSAKRKEEKKKRKMANYIKYGPKESGLGRSKKKKYGTHKQKQSKLGKDCSPTSPGPKARKKNKGLAHSKTRRSQRGVAKFPLKPLRKRRHLGSARPEYKLSVRDVKEKEQ